MGKILLVEDEYLLRETYCTILSTQACPFEVAEDGKVALDLCRSTVFDLILLDLMMPVMTGVQFMEEYLASTSRKDRARILVLSNLSSGSELDKAMKLGAHRSLVKSNLSPRQFLETVSKEISLDT